MIDGCITVWNNIIKLRVKATLVSVNKERNDTLLPLYAGGFAVNLSSPLVIA